MTNRFSLVAPIAVALSAAFFAAATPAAAASIDCATASGNLRAAAATAQPDTARKALNAIKTGEALCKDDARAEAGKKFAIAARTLGVDLASLGGTNTASATN